MTLKRRLTFLNWGGITLLFFGFLAWHGAFEGPLTEDEIRAFLTPFMAQYSDENIDLAGMSLDEFDTYLVELQGFASDPIEQGIDIEGLRSLLAFLRADDGKPIVMVNLLHERESLNGSGDAPNEALQEYGLVVFSFLIRRGSYPIFSGSAAMDVLETWGIEDAEEWTSAALVRYRSRRVMLEMTQDPTFNLSHEDKVVSLEKTIGLPTDVSYATGDLSVTVGLLLLSIGLGLQLLINRRKIDDEEREAHRPILLDLVD